MSQNTTDAQELEILEQKIKLAKANNESIEKYVLREIEILQNTINIFLEKANKEGNLDAFDIGTIEIRQYAAIRQLAKSINYPIQKYDEAIKAVKIRLFGEENYDIFFGD